VADLPESVGDNSSDCQREGRRQKRSISNRVTGPVLRRVSARSLRPLSIPSRDVRIVEKF